MNTETQRQPCSVQDVVRAVRAVRAALLPPVAPLRPGETVMIPDSMLPHEAVEIEFPDGADFILIDAQTADNEPLALDAAGVRALIETCCRWLVDTGSLY